MRLFASAGAAVLLLAGAPLPPSALAADEARPSTEAGRATSSQLPTGQTQDEDFLRTAPGLLLPQIVVNRMAAEKADDQQVAALARQMTADFSKLAEQLKEAAQAADQDVSTRPDPHAVHRVQRLEDAGPAFDLTFLIEQESWHKKLIAIYSMEERAGQNKALKSYADHGRSVLSRNLAAIQELRSRLTERRTTPG